MRLRFALPLLAATLVAAPSAAAAPVCAPGGPAAAARALYGPGTALASTGRVAGLRTALALQPLVAPGTRRRMLRGAEGWCDAATGFNRVWRGGDGAAAASAYARVAAAPYFDGVRVLSARRIAAGLWELSTHAQTNGVVARWTIAADATGIASATWAATAFAQHPLRKQWEGLTALPGATETYTRLGATLVERRGLPTPENRMLAGTPGLANYVGSDGMTLSVGLGDTHVAVDPGADTGNTRADIVRVILRALKVNYEAYRSWGFTKGWNARTDAVLPDRGFVGVDDSLSLYCQACVLTGEEFNIHLISEVPLFLAALGYTYPDEEKAWQDVVGHEMFHNFQNRYNKPGQPLALKPGQASIGYSEGTARFQETLHGYSDVSRTPGSLYYAKDTNGCNGYDTGTSMDAAMASGPFAKSYNACYFWSAWYAAFGPGAFVKLVTESYPANMTTADAATKGLAAIEQATGRPVAEQMQAFALAALTGRNLAWGPLAGGEAYNWGQALDIWEPRTIAPGGSATANLANGGMMARELRGAATVSVSDAGKVALFAVRDDGSAAAVVPLDAAGSPVAAPAAGERVWVVAVRPSPGTSQGVTLRAS